jgi:HNH endonuclease
MRDDHDDSKLRGQAVWRRRAILPFRPPSPAGPTKGDSMLSKSTISRLSEQYIETIADRLILGTVKGPNGCILWTKSLHKKGYGTIKIGNGTKNGLLFKTHRISWEIFHGPIPDGLFVLHSCDVPRCVNPCHLWLGTNQDNMDDMNRKGRNGLAKITVEQLIEIRRLADAVPRGRGNKAMTLKNIGAMFGLTHSMVSMIRSRKFWSHIPG